MLNIFSKVIGSLAIALLMRNAGRWGNRGDVEDYSLEVEVYDY